MMILQKWNYNLREYELFMSPANEPALFEENMDALKDCANCGRSHKFGEMYTSRTIHNQVGLGFGVCEACYQEEFNLEKEAKHE